MGTKRRERKDVENASMVIHANTVRIGRGSQSQSTASARYNVAIVVSRWRKTGTICACSYHSNGFATNGYLSFDECILTFW